MEKCSKWKDSKSDIRISKNYLNENEITELNRIVNMYLDYAELQVRRKKVMLMGDWNKKLDSFLQFNEYEILDNPGKVSSAIAKTLAEMEFDKYRPIQDRHYISDFDKSVEEYLKKHKDD